MYLRERTPRIRDRKIIVTHVTIKQTLMSIVDFLTHLTELLYLFNTTITSYDRRKIAVRSWAS